MLIITSTGIIVLLLLIAGYNNKVEAFIINNNNNFGSIIIKSSHFIGGTTTTSKLIIQNKCYSSSTKLYYRNDRNNENNNNDKSNGRRQQEEGKSLVFSKIQQHNYNNNSNNNNWNITTNTAARSTTGQPLQYLQWNENNNDNTFALQTAIQTFKRGNDIIELHALIHFANKEYYEYFNNNNNNFNPDIVLYELLVDDSLLIIDDQYGSINNSNAKFNNDNNKLRMLKQPIQSSLYDRELANQYYDWSCQVDCIDYSNKNNIPWFHADLTRQEFVNLVNDNNNNNNNKPLWQLSNNKNKVTAQPELATALLIGPPSMSTIDSPKTRRIFTNLFLPGNTLAILLRLLLWISIPSPELSILLLDWSSIWITTKNNNNNNNKSKKNDNKNAILYSRFSQIGIPILHALSNGRFNDVRKLLFGQVIVSGHSTITTSISSDNNNDDDILISYRNNRALQVLEHVLNNNNDHPGNNNKGRKIALLYGCNHCPDLHYKLVNELGFVPVVNREEDNKWRTAWSVPLSNNKQQQSSSSSSLNTVIVTLAIIIPTYLLIGGLDWIGTWQDIIRITADNTGTNNNASKELTGLGLFYLIRHVLLYVGLSKLLLDFGNNNNNNENMI